MRAIKKSILVLGIALPALLAGCENNSAENASGISTDIELTDISEVRESFNDEIDKIKQSNFDNISFENLSIYSFPEINTVHLLKVVKPKASADELYNFMCEKIDELMPGKYTDEQKMDGIRFVDAGYVYEDAEPSMYKFPNFQQYKENDLESESPWLLFNGKDHYFDVVQGWLRAYNSGAAAERDDNNSEDSLISYNLEGITSIYNTVYYTEDTDSERSFNLSGEDIKINQAKDFVDDFLENRQLSIHKSNITFCSDAVKVIDMNDGKYGYVFSIVGKYNGMKFSGLDMRHAESYASFSTNTTNEVGRPGSFCITETGKVDYYHLVTVYDVTEEETYASIIPLSKAAEITSNYLTSGMRFKAKSIKAVYKEISDKPDSEYIDNEAYHNREIHARPYWRFTLQPLTGNTDLLYHVFVDMITGETKLLVQTFQRGFVEYD